MSSIFSIFSLSKATYAENEAFISFDRGILGENKTNKFVLSSILKVDRNNFLKNILVIAFVSFFVTNLCGYIRC